MPSLGSGLRLRIGIGLGIGIIWDWYSEKCRNLPCSLQKIHSVERKKYTESTIKKVLTAKRINITLKDFLYKLQHATVTFDKLFGR